MPKTKDYLSEEQINAIKAVQKINNEMYDKEGWENHDTLLSITICSYMFSITLNVNKINGEFDIYNSGNDDRIYYEKSNKYEEWYSYIKRKFRELKIDLDDIKL
jgi:hypothetical protein